MNNHKLFHRVKLGILSAAVLATLAALPAISTAADAPPASPTVSASIDTPVGNVSVALDANVVGNGGVAQNNQTASTDTSSDKGHHGRVPVPEPPNWLSLGTLLAIGFAFVALDRRRRPR